jgi:VIT1/CCC1 family predicted Fe2+/Mn2+ transporter
MEKNNTTIKCIISFIFGGLFVSCIWIIAMFPNSAIAIPAIISVVIVSVTLFVLGLVYLVV